MPTVQLYVDGCDVCFDPARTENVRANLAAVGGRTYLLRPGDAASLGPAPVLDGRGCLALRAPGAWGAWAATAVAAGLRRRPAAALAAIEDGGGPAALAGELERLVGEGLTPGEALARLLPAGGGIVEGAPADWWLVPGGPLADVRAMARPRHVVEGGGRIGGE